MYRLDVFHPDQEFAHATVGALTAEDAMARIPLLLKEHGDCERIGDAD